MIETKGQIRRRLREHAPGYRDRLWGNAAHYGGATPYGSRAGLFSALGGDTPLDWSMNTW